MSKFSDGVLGILATCLIAQFVGSAFKKSLNAMEERIATDVTNRVIKNMKLVNRKHHIGF